MLLRNKWRKFIWIGPRLCFSTCEQNLHLNLLSGTKRCAAANSCKFSIVSIFDCWEMWRDRKLGGGDSGAEFSVPPPKKKELFLRWAKFIGIPLVNLLILIMCFCFIKQQLGRLCFINYTQNTSFFLRCMCPHDKKLKGEPNQVQQGSIFCNFLMLKISKKSSAVQDLWCKKKKKHNSILRNARQWHTHQR